MGTVASETATELATKGLDAGCDDFVVIRVELPKCVGPCKPMKDEILTSVVAIIMPENIFFGSGE